jgi:hypothetical protein
MTKAKLISGVTKAAKASKGTKAVPAPTLLLDGLQSMYTAYTEYHKILETETTARVEIEARKEIALEQIRSQRALMERALKDQFKIRRDGLEATVRALDQALKGGNLDALHMILDTVAKLVEQSPFKDIADMRAQLSDKDFVLRLK